MPENRFYSPLTFNQQQEITLEDEEFQHLKVMRVQQGDEIELINGKGQIAKGEILTLDKKGAHLILKEVQTEKPSVPLIIAQAIPRINRLDVILEKCTELGMTELWLFPGDLSEKTSFSEQQQHRIEKILISALKQCGSLFLPQIKILPSISTWKPFSLPTYFGDISKNAPTLLNACQGKPFNGAIFVVGPEKGFTDKEEAHLLTLGARGVSLHKNILRTDTAPIAALSIFSMLVN